MTKTIVDIQIEDAEKRRVPSKHYVYVIKVKWSDGSSLVVYRRYSRFFDLQTQLLEKFPIEGGATNPNLRIIPFLPGKIFFGRSHIRDVALKRLKEIESYCKNLLKLPKHISECDEVLEFFEVEPEDLDPPKEDMKQKGAGGEKKREKISGPKQLERFVAVADYSAQEKGEMNLQAGMVVEVTEKSESGWWFVNTEEHQGWVPSTYLQASGASASSPDTQDGNEEKYICIEAFSAENADEVSLEKGAIVEVLTKNMDGWWTVRYQGLEGFAPATYLKKSSDPYALGLVEKSLQSGVKIIGNLADVSNIMAPSSSPRNSTIVLSSAARNSSILSESSVKKHGEKGMEDVDGNEESDGMEAPVKHRSPTSVSESLVKTMPKQRSLERGGSLKPPPRQNSVKQMMVSPPPPPLSKTRSSTYLTVAAFEDTVGDGISFTVGETVTVLEKTDSGWWFVERGEDKGWVPESYLEQAGDSTDTQAGSAVESGDHYEENSDEEEESDDDYDDKEHQMTQPPSSALASALCSRLKDMNGQKTSPPLFHGGGPPKLPDKPTTTVKPPSLPGKPQDQQWQSQISPESSVEKEPGSPSEREKNSVSNLASALKSRFDSKSPGLPTKPGGGAPLTKHLPPGPNPPPHKPGPPSVLSKPPGPSVPPSKPGEKLVSPFLPQHKPDEKLGTAWKPKPPTLPTKPAEKPSVSDHCKKPEAEEGNQAAGSVASIASSLKSKFESGGPPVKPAIKPSIQTSKPLQPAKPLTGDTPIKPVLPSHKPDDGKPALGQKVALPSKKFTVSGEDTKPAFPSKPSGPPKLPFKPQTSANPASDTNNTPRGSDRPVSNKVHSMATAFAKPDMGHNDDSKPKTMMPTKKPLPPGHKPGSGNRESDVSLPAGKPRVGGLVSELGSKLQFGPGSGFSIGGGNLRGPEPSPTHKSAPWSIGVESSGRTRTASESSSAAPQLPSPMLNLLSKTQPTASNSQEYEAVADFAAEGEGELGLVCGDVVEVLDQTRAEWWMVRRGSKQGFVPSSYLEPAARWDD